MPASPVRSWDSLYDLIGYPEPDDPELACAIIITSFTASHQNRLIASENFYVNIKFHSYFSAVPVPHFCEVTQRLATVLPRETMACLSVEVLQLPNSPIRERTNFFHLVINPSDEELTESRR